MPSCGPCPSAGPRQGSSMKGCGHASACWRCSAPAGSCIRSLCQPLQETDCCCCRPAFCFGAWARKKRKTTRLTPAVRVSEPRRHLPHPFTMRAYILFAFLLGSVCAQQYPALVLRVRDADHVYVGATDPALCFADTEFDGIQYLDADRFTACSGSNEVVGFPHFTQLWTMQNTFKEAAVGGEWDPAKTLAEVNADLCIGQQGECSPCMHVLPHAAANHACMPAQALIPSLAAAPSIPWP